MGPKFEYEFRHIVTDKTVLPVGMVSISMKSASCSKASNQMRSPPIDFISAGFPGEVGSRISK